jgi:hypothetical protein
LSLHLGITLSLYTCLISNKVTVDSNPHTRTMRFTNELIVLVAATYFSAVAAAPAAAPEAISGPHNYFGDKYGDGYGDRRGDRHGDRHGGGWATPHFVQVGSWKRDTTAKAQVQKRDEPRYDGQAGRDRGMFDDLGSRLLLN